MYELQIRKEDL
jgi:hypothetical protein